RTLPPEDWVQQPPVPGKHTARVTIRQTGLGNAARELRVEGENGFWKKLLLEPQWQFVETGVEAGAALVEPGPVVTGGNGSRQLSGTLSGPVRATVITRDFDPDCSPARLELEAGGARFTAELYFHGGLSADKHGRKFQGALLNPRPIDARPVAQLFGRRPFID